MTAAFWISEPEAVDAIVDCAPVSPVWAALAGPNQESPPSTPRSEPEIESSIPAVATSRPALASSAPGSPSGTVMPP